MYLTVEVCGFVLLLEMEDIHGHAHVIEERVTGNIFLEVAIIIIDEMLRTMSVSVDLLEEVLMTVYVSVVRNRLPALDVL